MTTNRQPRRLRRQAGDGNGSGGGTGAPQSISDRLRIAREARGVDLFRVERDTKIRVKYLAAMEQGHFSELPADVYARGFLRNYASYLGLDPDEAELEWRRSDYEPAYVTPSVMEPAVFDLASRAPAVKMPPAMTPPPTVPVTRTRAAKAAPKKPAARVSVQPGPVAPPETGQAPAFAFSAFMGSALKQATVAWASFKSAAAARLAGSPGPGVARSPVISKPALTAPSATGTPGWRPRTLQDFVPEFLHKRDNTAPDQLIGGPKPITEPRRLLLLQPTHVVLLLLAVVILAVAAFFGFQANRVLQDPTLVVTAPAQGLYTVPVGTNAYTLKGRATSKAEISISWDLRDPMHTQADTAGNWSFGVTLHAGNNQFDIYATDLSTNHNSVQITRVIDVPTPTASPVPEFLSIDSPAEGAAFRDGTIVVTGTTVALTSVTVSAIYQGTAPSTLPTPAPVKTAPLVPTRQPTLQPLPTVTPYHSPTPTPRPTPTPNASNAPTPVQVTPTIDGKFSATIKLWSGRWKISVVGTNQLGVNTPPVQVDVIVTAGSLVVTLNVRGGPSAIKIWKDGRLYADLRQYSAGSNLRIVADQSVWFYSAAPFNVLVTVNGTSFGRLTSGHSPASWRMTAFTPPTISNDR
jgi:hypothetical protein